MENGSQELIKIGKNSNYYSSLNDEYLQTELLQNGNEVLVNNTKNGFEDLINENIDVLITPLTQLEVPFKSQIVLNEKEALFSLAGLSKRSNSAVGLVLPVGMEAKPKVPTNIPIYCSHRLLGLQYMQLITDSEIRTMNSGIMEFFNNPSSESVASLLPVEELPLKIEASRVFSFRPDEITPIPGQGVQAYLCLSQNKKIRVSLAEIHHEATMNCTNVERELSMNANTKGINEVLAHCWKDKIGTYQISAFSEFQNDKIKQVKFAQSTFIKMSETVLQKLLE